MFISQKLKDTIFPEIWRAFGAVRPFSKRIYFTPVHLIILSGSFFDANDIQ